MPPPALLVEVFDLVLGRTCLGCHTPGSVLCPECLALLRGGVRSVPLAGLAIPLHAASPYDGLTREAILEYKERGSRSLAPMLGRLLADAALAAARLHRPARCVLVPVPSHRHAPRGFDALGAVARSAARDLSRDGLPTRVERRLRPGPAYLPMKGLSRSERRTRIIGAFRAAGPTRPSDAGSLVLLIDDVVTTGATMSEALRTLTIAGMRVDAIAAVAATGPSRGRPARNPAPVPPTLRP
jgi:predicted amidophosphoribosyltransferase